MKAALTHTMDIYFVPVCVFLGLIPVLRVPNADDLKFIYYSSVNWIEAFDQKQMSKEIYFCKTEGGEVFKNISFELNFDLEFFDKNHTFWFISHAIGGT